LKRPSKKTTGKMIQRHKMRKTLLQNNSIRSRIEEWCDEKVEEIQKAKEEDHRKDDTAFYL